MCASHALELIKVSGIISERDYVCKIALLGKASKDTTVRYTRYSCTPKANHMQRLLCRRQPIFRSASGVDKFKIDSLSPRWDGRDRWGISRRHLTSYL